VAGAQAEVANTQQSTEVAAIISLYAKQSALGSSEHGRYRG
jgi:hypothetical protein